VEVAKYKKLKIMRKEQRDAYWNSEGLTARANIFRIVGGALVDEWIAGSANADANHEQANASKLVPYAQTPSEYIEETITDEMVQRVLAPVILMIREGKFDR